MPTLEEMGYLEQPLPDGCNNCIWQKNWTCLRTAPGRYIGRSIEGRSIELENEQVYGIGICRRYENEAV